MLLGHNDDRYDDVDGDNDNNSHQNMLEGLASLLISSIYNKDLVYAFRWSW